MTLHTSQALLEKALGSSASTLITGIKKSNDDDDQSPQSFTNVRHWRDLSSYLETLQVIPETKATNMVDDKHDGLDIGKDPLQQPVDYRICNSCGTAILIENIIEHLKTCGKEVKPVEGKETVELIKDTPTEVNESPKKNTKKSNTKRKNENVKDGPDLKKVKVVEKKKDVKATKNSKSKAKGPVDVEKQCGVPLPNGGFCARSLTCKTHSMGAKRAVQGRSAPYDQLLAAYQRKNQAKIGAAAAAAQQAKDDLLHGAGVAIDDDEETRQVLKGVRTSFPAPLERVIPVPVRMRTGYLRMREMFASNLLPRLQNNPLGKMYARAAVMNVENIDESSHYPVRSQHQKNNQQRQLQLQLQKHQLQKQAQLQKQTQVQMQMQNVRVDGNNVSQPRYTGQQINGVVPK